MANMTLSKVQILRLLKLSDCIAAFYSIQKCKCKLNLEVSHAPVAAPCTNCALRWMFCEIAKPLYVIIRDHVYNDKCLALDK